MTCHRRGEGVGRLSAKRSGVTHPLRQSPDRHATRRGANACQPFAARRRYVRTLCRRLAGGDPRAGHAILAGCHDTALLSDRRTDPRHPDRDGRAFGFASHPPA